MASSSQNATFEHCISQWMPRPRVSGPLRFVLPAFSQFFKEPQQDQPLVF
jgi:hypothetical protein